MNKFLASSADPTKLSMTVRGVLVAIIPLLVVFTGLGDAEVNAIIDLIVNIVFWVTSIVSAVVTLYGLVRKVQLGRWSAE